MITPLLRAITSATSSKNAFSIADHPVRRLRFGEFAVNPSMSRNRTVACRLVGARTPRSAISAAATASGTYWPNVAGHLVAVVLGLARARTMPRAR